MAGLMYDISNQPRWDHATQWISRNRFFPEIAQDTGVGSYCFGDLGFPGEYLLLMVNSSQQLQLQKQRAKYNFIVVDKN